MFIFISLASDWRCKFEFERSDTSAAPATEPPPHRLHRSAPSWCYIKLLSIVGNIFRCWPFYERFKLQYCCCKLRLLLHDRRAFCIGYMSERMPAKRELVANFWPANRLITRASRRRSKAAFAFVLHSLCAAYGVRVLQF